MKRLITNYSFVAASKTITFSDYASINLERVLIIDNATDQIIIYNFADTSKGGTVATNVLTLEYDTTSMDNSDNLLIYYDDPAYDTAFKEDSAHTSGDAGTMALTVRKDSRGTIAGTDGDYSPLQINSSGDLRVDGSAVTQPVSGTVAVTQSGTWDEVGINDSGNSITVDNVGTFATQSTLQSSDNTVGRVKLTDGTTVASVRDLASNDALNVAIVDGSGTQITSFGGGTQYTEADTDASITGTAMMWEDTSDTLRAVSASKPLPIGDAGGSLTIDGTVTASNAAGDVAHDTADSGNPVKVGFKSKNYGSLITAVTDGDRANGQSDRYGAQFVQNGSSYVRANSSEYSANQTAAAMITAGASESVRVYGFVITIDYNSTSTLTITIGYGTSSLDTVIYKGYNLVPGVYPIMLPAAICGASNEDLRITFSGYSAGFLNVITYYDLIAI